MDHPRSRIFEGAHEGHEGFGFFNKIFSNFVIFATFVVKIVSSFWFAALPRCVSAVSHTES
jgi:hypothetical protein